MSDRRDDGSAGDADYGTLGATYRTFRQPDPHIAAWITRALGSARTVLNVGAGAGSYEPSERQVTAIEPSKSMRAQRPLHLTPAIDGVAENLPFANGSFEAAMALFTVHQWGDLAAGLRELRRVTVGPILILTCDPSQLDCFWLTGYAPEVIATEARRYPSIAALQEGLGNGTEVHLVPIPLQCTDGFNEAYYGRPERLLEPGARQACSAWSFVDASVVARFVCSLENDLKSGAWDAQHGHLRTQPEIIGSLRLVVASSGAAL